MRLFLSSSHNSMDRNGDHVVFSFDSNEVLTYVKDKKKAARRRWAILAKALKSPSTSQPSSPTDEYSVRRISSLMLLTPQELPAAPVSPDLDPFRKCTWYKYCLNIDGIEYYVNVGHRNRTFSAEDLMGFNNTGNVCIWPSEETLSYYVCSNLNKFEGRTVIELGGGMSCLAGLFVAKYSNASNVVVSDGNKNSVENVKIAVRSNEFQAPVQCKILVWSSYDQSEGVFDVILCADCLFFDDARADLIECLWKCMKIDGIALIMAPRRGDTLDRFVAQSEARGFSCKVVTKYNDVVWERRHSLLENCDFDDDIHYPVLVEVTKK